MERLQSLIDRLKNFEEEIVDVIEKAVKDNQEIILDMNSELQLYEQGVDRNNIKIASYAPYSPITIELKRQKGQPTGRVTLRDEGDFHYSFYIEFLGDGFKIAAKDWKTKMLISNYGEAILGLTDENFADLAQNYIAPEVVKLFKKL